MKFSTKITLQINQQLIVDVPLCDAIALAERILATAAYAEEWTKRREWGSQINVFEGKR